MRQMSLYDFFGKSNDPLYNKLANLSTGDSFFICEIEVTMNIFGLYEISHSDTHEAFSTIDKCYLELNKIINSMETGIKNS